MKPLIIPIFVVYKGCPNRCVYCNERVTAGNYPERITEEQFRNTVDGYLSTASKDRDRIEIAFYGGNFTGIDIDYQTELLRFAEPYIKDGRVQSIRISTRPDYIDHSRTRLLRKYHVTMVEIGAQSMIDTVLDRSRRRHSSDDVRNAVKILKESGLGTGIHIMAGLPGDTEEGFMYTVAEIIKLNPDTVRIHPTIVLKDTPLAEAYMNGQYRPLSMDEAVSLCGYALSRFRGAGISVIRLGLHNSEEMNREGSIIAGPCHPAFGAIVEGSIFLDMASRLLTRAKSSNETVTFSVSSKDVSRFRGLKNCNISMLKDRHGIANMVLKEDLLQETESIVLMIGRKTYKTDMKSCYPS